MSSKIAKNAQRFIEFKQAFKLDLTYTMEKLFADVPEAKGAFEAFVIKADSVAEEEASEYLDVDGSY